MAEAIVGALRVVLGADTGAFEDGLRKAEKQLGTFAGRISTTGLAIGTAIAAGATAMAFGIKSVLDEADKLNKLSQSVGVPVEQLSELKFAADLAGVGIEGLGNSIGKLSKTMAAAAAQTKGEAADAFRAVGVSVTDATGKLKSTDQVLGELANKFAQYEDGAAKTALAIHLFGRAGADIIPLLNQGAAGIANAREEAHQFGIVIDKETAQAAENFNDNLTRLSAISRGLVTIFAAQLAPSLETLSNGFVEAAKDGERLKTASDLIVSSFRFLVEQGISVVGLFQSVSASVRGFVDAAKLLGRAEFSQAFQALKDSSAEADRIMTQTQERIRTLWDKPAEEAAAKAPAQAKKIAAPIIQSMKEIEAERAKASAAFAAIEAEQEAILAKFRTPAEEIVFEIDKINQAFARGIITQQQWGFVMERIAERMRDSITASVASIAGSLGDLTAIFGKQNKAIGVASKAFAVTQAVINTYLGATKALATTPLPPPAPQIAAAAIIASGLAMVARIVSQPAFAKGGSFMVPGGISGVDTKTVPLSLAAGERVDITPASQARAGGVTTIELRTPRVKDFFSENIRELVDSINAAAPDGYIIRMPA